MPADVDTLKREVATACRILGHRGLATGTLGHVSARLPGGDLLLRCRGSREKGLAHTTETDVRLASAPGDGWSLPKEAPIHRVLLERRPDAGAVVHAHPPAALLLGLAELAIRPVFGAYNLPALRMARSGIPVYPRPILITRDELAAGVADVLGDGQVCLLRGHGIVTVGPTVRSALVAAVNLEVLCRVTVDLHRLGARPPDVSGEDLAELPDLGSAFDDDLTWQALVADLG